MNTMTTKMACELILGALAAFAIISCVALVMCEILYRRLVAAKKMLIKYQSPLSSEKIEIIPKTRVIAPTIGNRYFSKVANQVSLIGSTFRNPENQMPNAIAVKIKQIRVLPFFIVRVYKGLKHCVNQQRQEPEIFEMYNNLL
jgi:hypothetical protein